ncbi:MAG: PHP domain-containing protein [Anaerolineaceae bacterium]|nr:PHP domain-containing protein [Anaerolineaceae bacterium]
MNQWLRVEFHCHSLYSPDSLNSLEGMIETAHKKGIDRLIITDHNTIAGAVRAHEMDPELIIVGEEIMTQKGELLAAFVKEEVPAGLEPEEALRRLREQDAFISVSHPFDHSRAGWAVADLEAILPYVDAIEVFNARCWHPSLNEQAMIFAGQHNLSGTVGSDAHMLFELGKANLLLPPFMNARELAAVIRDGQPETSMSQFWVHFGSTYAKLYKSVFRSSSV